MHTVLLMTLICRVLGFNTVSVKTLLTDDKAFYQVMVQLFQKGTDKLLRPYFDFVIYNITLLPAEPVICLGGNHETKANAQMVYN